MKIVLCTLIVAGIFLMPGPLWAQQRNVGLGAIIGEPTGLSGKVWTSPTTAFDFGVGWSFGGDHVAGYEGTYDGGSRVHIHADYLWHSFDAIRSSERFPLYYGIGTRLNAGGGYYSSLAVRGVMGIAWLPRATPLDIFLEIVPSLQLVRSTGFGIDAGVGGRVFF